jgi:hypothetical protein
MLRHDTGAIRSECSTVANMAVAGGILMELALLGRIDTDLRSLFIVDPKPIGDELLDHALRDIAARSGHSPAPENLRSDGRSREGPDPEEPDGIGGRRGTSLSPLEANKPACTAICAAIPPGNLIHIKARPAADQRRGRRV